MLTLLDLSAAFDSVDHVTLAAPADVIRSDWGGHQWVQVVPEWPCSASLFIIIQLIVNSSSVRGATGFGFRTNSVRPVHC